MSERGPHIVPLLALTLAGVLLRLAFVLTQGDTELSGDEGVYLYLALAWRHLGFYPDAMRFLWPPGYPFVLERALAWSGEEALRTVQVLQVLASASTGLCTMLLARRIAGRRAALAAGALWCVYVPLMVFDQSFWSESLFLALFSPAMLLALGAVQGEGSRGRTLAAALCTAGALYLKESPLYLLPVLAGAFALGTPDRREGLGRALFFLLVVALALAPWQRHARLVHGRFVPVGASIGENAFLGINAGYQNFDFTPLNPVRGRTDRTPLHVLARDWSVRGPAGGQERGWERAEELQNLPDRQAENLRRGLDFARQHPGWFLRSRLRKLADLLTPLSIHLRDQALEVDTGRARRPLGRPLVALTALLPPLLFVAALAGLFLARTDPRSRALLVLWLGYFLATSLLVAMSRFRAPMLPALLALAGAGLAGPRRPGTWPRAGLALALGLLLGAWWLTWPETRAVLAMAWEAVGR